MAPDPISEAKERALRARMAELGIDESDLQENFILGSGKGGQKVNRTASCVQLRHEPSGIEIRCQKTRSQSQNRFYARRELCEKIAEAKDGERSKRQQEIEKIRRQKRRRSRRQKARMLDDKRKHSEKKQGRKRVDPGRE